MRQLYDIPTEIYDFDDIRIDKLQSGAISLEEFMRLIRPDDPFTISAGVMKIITKEDVERTKTGFIHNMKGFLRDTGGIGGAVIYNNRDVFIEAYPELKEDIDAFTKSLNGEKCEGCAVGQKTAHLVVKLLALPTEGRKLGKVEALMQTQGPYARFSMMKLRGEKFEVEDKDIFIPEGMIKRELPLKKNRSANPALPAPPAPIADNSAMTVDEDGLVAMDGCKMCVLKHLSEAMVLAVEVLQGYSNKNGHFKHMARLIGNLSAGESECVKFDADLAMRIRILRLKIMGQKENSDG